jgi:hypothetical protein
MKLLDVAIRLILDDWIAQSSGLAYSLRYGHMTYWYGKAIYIVMPSPNGIGVNFAARNTGIGLHAYWPDPYRLSVDCLRQLDADIDACRHEEIVTFLIAFKKEVVAQ